VELLSGYGRRKRGKQMKYKVGDKVRIRRDLEIGQLYDGCLCTKGMQDLAGKVVCITEVHKIYGNHRYCIASSSWYWTDEMFEDKSMGTDKRVIIDSDGGEVAAIDLETGKKGVARCHPDDAFDFFVGAKIALERLEEAEKPYGWLKVGVKYYVPMPAVSDLYNAVTYTSDDWDKMIMKRGVAFQTKEEAIACAKKMLTAVKQEV
jgi:hypothetical protein